MTSEFSHTATNMVNHVNSIIASYNTSGGPIRALAQEPVQNSKDAKRGNPFVEYKLHTRRDTNGQPIWLLTVTDWNTCGLQGRILTLEEIDALGRLNEEWNWAAFEGMHYTKENDDALGSRGQGKAAFLYHSTLPPLGDPPRGRMMILYDTLLPDDEYRLGVRYATPSDRVRTPPFIGDDARQTVSSSYVADDGTHIELNLDPLTRVGTRVIIPHLSQEAVDAFHSGELYNWLQRCWWRAVQTGLTISLVDEVGNSTTVVPPDWWEGEPWERSHEHIRVWQDLGQGNARIKRIVLYYDPNLVNGDTEGYLPQFCGVQLLRGQQWIETLSHFDEVSPPYRAGFRGFVEFDRSTEPLLKAAESSQHDGFNKRRHPCNVLMPIITQKVREFAEYMGWTERQSIQPAPGRERDAGLRFLRFFSQPRTRGSHGDVNDSSQGRLFDDRVDQWECELALEFPSDRTARVNYGESIGDVTAHIRLDPPDGGRRVTVQLVLAPINVLGSRVVVEEREADVWDGAGHVDFGDFQIIRGAPGPERLQCAQQGKWRLTAEVHVGGARVASDTRILYIQEDPPTRNTNLYTLSISAENLSRQQPRIDSGDTLGVQVNVKNNTPDNVVLEVNVTLGDTDEGILARRTSVNVGGTPVGESARRFPALQRNIVVNPLGGTAPNLSDASIVLPPGTHRLSADLFVAGNDQAVAHATKTIYVDQDPPRTDQGLPFDIRQTSGDSQPRWYFNKDDTDLWILLFSPTYPLYEALTTSKAAFMEDVCAEGLVEWALSTKGTGDESRLEDLLRTTPVGVDQQTWEDFREKMRSLAASVNEPEDWAKTNQDLRECAAKMLSMYRVGA